MNILNLLKLWPVPVLIFCLYSLYSLFEESNEFLYQKRNETDPFQFLACVELSQVYPKKTEIDLEELGGDLYKHFNSSEEYSHGRTYPRGFELTLNKTKSGGYLAFDRRVCLVAKDLNELQHIEIFIRRNKPVLFAVKSDTFDFVRMGSPSDQIDQLVVVQKREPSYSDCDESNGRFLCLNECFRSHFRLSRYFYQANETGSILLHFNESNRTIQVSERICFGVCKRENCKLVKLISGDSLKEPKTEIFEAQPKLSLFEFFGELFGRIFLFVGLFFDQIASIATKLTRSRVRRKKVKTVLFYLNLAILLLILAYCGYLCVPLVLDYNTETNELEIEMTRNLIQPKIVHLTICVHIYRNDYEEKMMWEIERATDRAFYNALEGIYVSDGERLFRADYQVHRKILFKIIMSRYLGRCFPLSIQPNYQKIPSRSILIVRFKKSVYTSPSLYVLSEEENLNQGSFWYSGFYAFQKRIVKRLKSRGCVNYGEKYGNCTGRQNCLERCIARKFTERFNRTTWSYGQVIDRDRFSASEWKTTRMMGPNKSLYLNISRECEKKFPEKECDETKFEETFKIKQPDYQTREIDLQFDVVQSVEGSPSSSEMALDLLRAQSIFFAFTFLKFFWLVYRFTKPRWRLRNDKFVWFLVCLLCSLGCSWTTILMDDVIINEDLVPTEHYEMAEQIQMPAMVFCLRIDQKLIDKNHKLTGQYLEELTRQMSLNRVFSSMAYLNESNEWTAIDLRRIQSFFLQNLKCFRMNIDQVYDRNQFHFSDDTKVLRANFNEEEENGLVYFMTQSKETTEFSKLLYLDSFFTYRISHEAYLYEHEDRFSYLRRYFPPLPEGDVGDLRGQLLDLQSNEPSRRMLSLPVEEEHFGLKIYEDYFEQLYSVQVQKNSKKRTNLNYRQTFFANHLETSLAFRKGSDFGFNLVFPRKVVHLTNKVSPATFTLSLINLLSIWLELNMLDISPFFVRLHECFLVYLYLHLPVLLLRKLVKALIFCCGLRRFEPILYERIDSQWKEEEEEEDDAPDDSSDESSVTYPFRLLFLIRLVFKFFHLL